MISVNEWCFVFCSSLKQASVSTCLVDITTTVGSCCTHVSVKLDTGITMTLTSSITHGSPRILSRHAWALYAISAKKKKSRHDRSYSRRNVLGIWSWKSVVGGNLKYSGAAIIAVYIWQAGEAQPTHFLVVLSCNVHVEGICAGLSILGHPLECTWYTAASWGGACACGGMCN